MLGEGLLSVLVDGEKGLAGTPVHLANELATEGVDDTGDGGSGALADEVKVEHALHGSGLHATIAGQFFCSISLARFRASRADLLYEASCLVVEESVVCGRENTAGRGEAGNVVVGRLIAVAGRGGSRGHDESVAGLKC